MTGKSYSNKAIGEFGSESNWAEVADKAAKKAEDQVNKIKREAQELIKENKASFNNPNEDK